MKESDKKYIKYIERIRELELENEKLKKDADASNSDLSNESFYKLLIDTSKDGLIIVQDAEIKYTNQGLIRFSGYELDEIVGMKFMEFVHPDDREKVIEYNRKRANGEEVPTDYEIRATDKAGKTIYLGINASIINYQGRPATVAALRDVTDRVNAENTLKRKEMERSFILEVINDGYWDWDVPNNKLYFNKNFRNITGYNLESINIPNIEELVFLPAPERMRFMQLASEFITEGRVSFTEEFEVSKADGTTGWVNVRGRVYEQIPDGPPLRIMGTFTDITQLKLAEQMLKANLTLLSTLMNTIPSPVFYKNRRGIYEGCNHAFSELTGIPVDGLIGRTVFDMYEPELAQVYFDADEKIFNSKQRQIYDAKIRHADGSLRDVIFYKNVYFNDNNELAGLVGVIFDNTERKQIAEELLKQKQFLESILRNLPLIMFVLNNDGVFTLSEGQGLSAMNLKPGQVVGSSIYEIYKNEHDTIRSFESALKGETKFSKGFYSNHYYEIYFNSLINEAGKKEGLMGIMLDVSKREIAQMEIQKYLLELEESKEKLEKYSLELNEKNKELEESEERLLELNAAKDKFFSLISHDLRSPFMSLLNLTDLLSTDYESFSELEIKESFESLKRSAKNIYSLLENLLEWAKVQMGKQEIFPSEVNLLSTVETIIAVYKVSIDEKKIEIIKDINPEMDLFVDPNVLHTVIRNIISNAIKFTNTHGKISIFAKCKNNACELIISDTGIGMDQEAVSNLFSIEQHKTTNGLHGEKGSGLGLILAKDLVEASGGSIKAESKLNVGTTFTIIFPLLLKRD